MQQRIIVGNVCFILDRARQEILLLKRSRAPMQGLFTGVGGKTRFSEDIRASCLREIREETGINAAQLVCRGVIKTLPKAQDSSWILFLYTAEGTNEGPLPCPEGELYWIPLHAISSVKLIGFIQELLPYLLQDNHFIEGTFLHDEEGNVLQKEVFLSAPARCPTFSEDSPLFGPN